MVDRVCISINNQCNLACEYCHFREKDNSIKPAEMNVFLILDNIRKYINANSIEVFKIGFVGNGEPLLDYELLKQYIEHIDDLIQLGVIRPYTITNGLLLDREKLLFFKNHNTNVGISIDGPRNLHNKYRCDSFDEVMTSIELYKEIFNEYPSMNCTIGSESIDNFNSIIDFFKRFDNRVTFSRRIGRNGISLDSFRLFLEKASQELNVRTGGYDCTMYGGLCGAGMNNYFYANGRIFLCGNCVDLESLPYDTPISDVDFEIASFDRSKCYKESFAK